MLAEILSVVAPLFVCAGIGFVWGRLEKPFDAEMMTGLALHLGVPCLVFSTLTRLEIDPVAFGEMAGAYTLALVLFMALAAALTRLLRLEARAFIPALTFRNSGNLGLPVCLFAFGEAGLAYGIGCFVIAALSGLTVGRGIYAGSTVFEALFRNPIVYAIAVSLAFMIGGIEPPAWLANTVQIVSGMAIPLMVVSLGVALSKIRVVGIGRAAALSALELGVGFAVGVALADLFGLAGVARGVLILQCAMPVAVHNYVFAQVYRRSPETVAGMVVMSSLLACFTLPAVLWYVLR
ncbi:MAG: AEC family transporter [Defluviicoccus sp.]|nr:AEC family transporter [Defluviicoccus sp.]MDE0384075.1 AEC family transporter [Defluviicoccus sp.]